MSTWQPIETAPKDGTRILTLNIPNEVKKAPAKVKVSYFTAVQPGHFMHPGAWMFEGAEPLSYEATLWMPLPPPPEGE
jgi:hypothetical protein